MRNRFRALIIGALLASSLRVVAQHEPELKNIPDSVNFVWPMTRPIHRSPFNSRTKGLDPGTGSSDYSQALIGVSFLIAESGEARSNLYLAVCVCAVPLSP